MRQKETDRDNIRDRHRERQQDRDRNKQKQRQKKRQIERYRKRQKERMRHTERQTCKMDSSDLTDFKAVLCEESIIHNQPRPVWCLDIYCCSFERKL